MDHDRNVRMVSRRDHHSRESHRTIGTGMEVDCHHGGRDHRRIGANEDPITTESAGGRRKDAVFWGDTGAFNDLANHIRLVDRRSAKRHDGEPFVNMIGSKVRVADDQNGSRVREVLEQRIRVEAIIAVHRSREVVEIEVKIYVAPDLFGLVGHRAGREGFERGRSKGGSPGRVEFACSG
jgi:hypothetical protein